MENQNAPTLELGSWLGRSQAFGMVSNHCSAAQAKCLQEIRNSETYKSLGLTWDDFCPAYTGLSRKQIDAIVKNLDEFGATYFRLSEIVRISPDTYRQLASLPHPRRREADARRLAESLGHLSER